MEAHLIDADPGLGDFYDEVFIVFLVNFSCWSFVPYMY